MTAQSSSSVEGAACYEEIMQAGENAVLIGDYETAAPLYARAVALQKSSIILFGDSHYHMYLGVPGLTPLWLNAVTAHRVGRDGLDFIDPARFGATPQTRLGFCFGEIDVRNHIGKIADEKGLPISQVATELADRYLAGVAAISAGYRQPFVTTTVPQHALSPGHPYAETVRPLEERLAASLAFNAALKARAALAGVDVVDITPAVADDRGLLRDDVTDDDIHVRSAEGKRAVVILTRDSLTEFRPRGVLTDSQPARSPGRWIAWLKGLLGR